jgi:hypothetical protein
VSHQSRIVAVLTAVVAAASFVAVSPPPAGAATPTEWRATLDKRDPPSTSVVRAPAGGQASIHTQVSGLAPGKSYAVLIRRGTCSRLGATIFSLGSVRARSDGQAVWTAALTGGQLAALRTATAGSGRASLVLGSSVRCGAFARKALAPSPAHRIGVRVVGGSGEFFDRATGARWVPRGANYIRLGAQKQADGSVIVSHSTFNTALYDPVRADRALRRMRADGYNATRVWLDGCCGGGLGDRKTNQLSAGYLDNLADFLERARTYGIQVMPTLDWLPDIPRYSDVIARDCCSTFNSANAHFLAPAGLEANQKFFRDLISGLKARGARLDFLWSWQLRNEFSFDSNEPPLSWTAGTVTAANGTTYDMASPSDHKRIMDESLAWYIDRSRAAIRAVDPTGLVSIGFFVPQEPNPARVGDPRVIDTRPSYASTADFVDLHAYPGLDLSFDQLAENYGMNLVPPTKPVILGEMGAFRVAYTNAEAGGEGIADWQIRSCPRGADGWLTWTWDLEDPAIYTAVEAGGAIEKALAPSVRPDPCAWGSLPHDLARGRPATASASVPGEPPSNAFDGVGMTKWSSGGGPPQWIQVDLGGASMLSSVQLLVSQFPNGATTHRIHGRLPGGAEVLLAELSGESQDSRWLLATPPTPGAWPAVTAVRVETTASPSWVAWWEVRVMGGLVP